MYNLNLTVSLYSQLIVMPTYECCMIFGTMLSGGLVLGEFQYYTNLQLSIICAGCCVCVSGILYRLSMNELKDEDDDQKQEGDVSESDENKSPELV